MFVFATKMSIFDESGTHFFFATCFFYYLLLIRPTKFKKLINSNSKRIDHVNRIDFYSFTACDDHVFGIIFFSTSSRERESELRIVVVVVHVLQFWNLVCARSDFVSFIMIPPAWKHNQFQRTTHHDFWFSLRECADNETPCVGMLFV